MNRKKRSAKENMTNMLVLLIASTQASDGSVCMTNFRWLASPTHTYSGSVYQHKGRRVMSIKSLLAQVARSIFPEINTTNTLSPGRSRASSYYTQR